MISSGDSLRPNKLKRGDLILHFIGNEEEVCFVVMACVEEILIDGGQMAMAVESMVLMTPYKNLLN